VKVQNGYELDELHNVLITSPTNNQVLAYDSATQLWKNATNTPDGVTSITATAPLTGGTITSTGSIGLDQTALSITRSQVSDFTSGTVTSASTAQQAGTAVFATNAGTAVYATTSGTALTISGTITKSQVSDFTSGTVASASTAQQSGTAVYSVNSGTAVYATTSGTAVSISGSITKSQVSDFTSGTVASAGFATTSGTAVFATNSGTAVNISGTVTQSQVTSLVTDLAGKASLGAANAFTVGAQTINTGAVGNKGLVVVGVASQSANLFEVQTSSSTAVRINQVGNTTFAGNITSQNNATFTPASAATVPLTVQGASGQTADILAIQNNGAANLAVFSSTGTFRTSGLITAGNVTDVLGQLSVYTTAASRIGAVVRGAASQSANLQEWQASDGTLLARVNQNGGATFANSVGISTTNFGFSAMLNVSTQSAGNIGVAIRGAASQSANLQEWQNSAGTVLARISSSGQIVSTTAMVASGDVVSTGGSVKAFNGLVTLGGVNSGGFTQMTKQTAATTNPGAGIGSIYFRDGTNAGTLKLVVRAGASGAETTILDNIPQ
jgi:hypothetical protein